jgi:L-alanine-DL-glutamate epimerase-like enolase superfamily enzyme
MNRRTVLGLAAAALTVPQRLSASPSPLAPLVPVPSSTTVIESSVVRLQLRHTWTTVMSSSSFRDVVQVRIHRDGQTGIGEGAPIPRYHETATSALRAIESVRRLLEHDDPSQFVPLLAEVGKRLPGEWAAKAAIAGAIADWLGQKLGVPLYRYFGLDPQATPVTTMSIGIDSPEMTKQKVLEAADFPVLKIKVGLDTDEATIAAVRSVTSKPLRVDANEGWKSKEEALRKLTWLAKQGVELVEQPLPAAQLAEAKWLKARSPLPIFADESCLRPSDIPRVVETCHGVNIKLDKCGGIFEAHKMIAVARAHGLKVMLGCMIESSVAIAAAAHLTPLVDYADLDGFLLIGNDPMESVTVRRGKLVLSPRPGLGLVPRQT